MPRRRSPTGQLERELSRYARRQRPSHGQLRRTADDVAVVADRFAVEPDWRRTDGGRAARLAPDQRIELRGHGRFVDRDPGQVVVGWRAPGRAGGLLLWAGVIGASWWLGGRGRGPLADARADRRW